MKARLLVAVKRARLFQSMGGLYSGFLSQPAYRPSNLEGNASNKIAHVNPARFKVSY